MTESRGEGVIGEVGRVCMSGKREAAQCRDEEDGQVPGFGLGGSSAHPLLTSRLMDAIFCGKGFVTKRWSLASVLMDCCCFQGLGAPGGSGTDVRRPGDTCTVEAARTVRILLDSTESRYSE